MNDDTIVVGAGLAGLVLARRLALGGRRVTVLEQDDRTGGQIWRHTLDGAVLDAAADSFATREGVVESLLRELGLGDDLVLPRPASAWVHRTDRSSAPLPATGVLGIPADPLAADVIAAIGRDAALRAQQDAVLPAHVGADAGSLGELVLTRMGRGVLDGLVAPVVRGVHSRDPHDLRVETASPRLRSLLLERGSLAAAVRALRESAPAGSQVAGIRGGIFRLVDALSAECERLGVRVVRGIRVDSVGPRAVTANGHTYEGEAVLASADPSAPAPERRHLTLVTLIVDAPALDAAPRGTGVLVAAGAPDVTARALTHLSAKWQWVADALPGRHAVRLSFDGAPEAPIDTALHDAATLLGVSIDRVIDADAIGVLRPVPSASAPRTDGIEAVGEDIAGTGLASVVAQAERTARDLLTNNSTVETIDTRNSRTTGSRDRMEQ